MASLADTSPQDGFERVGGFFRSRRNRFILYAVFGLAFAILSLFPRYYVSRVKMISQDAGAGGLNSALGMLGGGLQNFASLLGSHQNAEVYLMIGRSNEVSNGVIKQARLIERGKYPDATKATVALKRKVDIHSLNGGVIEVEVKDRDPAYALELVNAYRTNIEARVAKLSSEQTAHKKELVTRRFTDATTRLAQAQTALENFRKANNLAEPGTQFGSELGMRTQLEAQLRAKQMQLQTLRQFNTDQSIEVKTILADIGSLQSQIARMDTTSSSALQGLASKSIEYLNLYREEQFAQALHEIYTRSVEQVTVQELISESNQDLSTLEEPFVESKRQFNLFGLAPLAALLLLAFYIEYYVPATRLGYSRPARG